MAIKETPSPEEQRIGIMDEVQGERRGHQLHLPIRVQGEIAQRYGLDIRDFFIGNKEVFSAPTISAELKPGIRVKTLDPLAAVSFFTPAPESPRF